MAYFSKRERDEAAKKMLSSAWWLLVLFASTVILAIPPIKWDLDHMFSSHRPDEPLLLSLDSGLVVALMVAVVCWSIVLLINFYLYRWSRDRYY